MMLSHRKDQEIDIVEIAGRLTLVDVAQAREKLKEIAQQGAGKMIIDLSATTFMDSGGLSVLISAYKAVQSRNGRLVLAAPSASIQSLIELTRLQHIFEIFQTTEAAVGALAQA
jgi:anti-sigma B factor antagonist